jgi:hypothetical protein
LPPDAPVLTPTGEVALSRLQVGDAVITLTQAGTRSVASVLRLARDPILGSHEMLVVRLENGRTLVGSAAHPLADGRTLGQLRRADHIEGLHVLSAERAPYAGDATWDFLPSGETGIYFVAGVPLKSTLLPRAPQ